MQRGGGSRLLAGVVTAFFVAGCAGGNPATATHASPSPVEADRVCVFFTPSEAHRILGAGAQLRVVKGGSCTYRSGHRNYSVVVTPARPRGSAADDAAIRNGTWKVPESRYFTVIRTFPIAAYWERAGNRDVGALLSYPRHVDVVVIAPYTSRGRSQAVAVMRVVLKRLAHPTATMRRTLRTTTTLPDAGQMDRARSAYQGMLDRYETALSGEFRKWYPDPASVRVSCQRIAGPAGQLAREVRDHVWPVDARPRIRFIVAATTSTVRAAEQCATAGPGADVEALRRHWETESAHASSLILILFPSSGMWNSMTH